MPVRCASSHVMSSVLAWRNPQGREENWLGQYQGVERRCKHIGKAIVAELAFSILAVSSIIETVVYATLALASLVLYPVTNKPCKFFAKFLQSSSFTMIWTITDIALNAFFINLKTHESFARYWGPRVFVRLDDIIHIGNWVIQHRPQLVQNAMLNPIIQEGAMQTLIDQGANFIAQEVLANPYDGLIESFKEVDPKVFMFVLTKAVYIYTFGARKEQQLPDFFKPATRASITALRQESLVDAELAGLVANIGNFEAGTKDVAARNAFNRLRNIASEESQGGFFITTCWQKAIETLA